MMRAFLRTVAALAVLPWLGIVYLLVTGSASWSSVGYVVATGVLLGGLVTLPDPASSGRRRRPRGLSRGGAIAIAGVALVRAFVAGPSSPADAGAPKGRLTVVRESRGDAAARSASSRLVNRLLDEGDVALIGTRLLFATGRYADDRAAITPAMTEAYRAMRRAEGDVASPLVATYLGLEDASAFDVVVVEPPRTQGSAAPDSAVLFLHGYAGGFDLPCWQVASAVARSGAVTACPSTRWVGDWWSPEGEAIVRRTVDMLRARGVARIVLAGLSNGGYGASRIAPRMKGVFAGLVLVSGAAADAPPAGIPTLLLHGTHDTVTSFESSRRYAARTGATLVSLDAGHFAMLVRAEEANRALGDFVAARVGVVARGGDGLSTRRGSAEGSSATPSRRPRLCRRADR